ncbi:MAG TPA: AraC family transcriptional regulator [Chitinophagaceae bacterium]|nr:AraC family transcriptional regulator [Chitinophagaceae bacterium]
MNQNLQTVSHEPLIWTEALPPRFKGIRLPGSTVSSSTGAFGSLCIQELESQHYSIRYNVFDIIQRFVLQVKSVEAGLHTRIMLKGHVDQEMNDDNKWSLRRNQVALLNASLPEITAFYNKNLHISFDTFFSRGLVNEILPMFPSVGKTFNEESPFLSTSHWADTETLELVHSILRCKYEKELRRHFFESRVRELLCRFLLEFSEQDPTQKPPTEEEVTSIYKAEEIINADISKHTNIPELAKKVLLNEWRFKIVFKKIFGMGPYEYLVSQRMKKGKELLKSGVSIKEVAALTGYRPTDFTEAFIHYYGYGPSTVRRKRS